MDALIISPTEYSPRVILDPDAGTFEIVGESRPEDVRTFYEPILAWLDEYQSYLASNKIEGKKYEFKVVLEYFNSTSAKYVLDVLMKLDNFVEDGHNFQVNWHYEKIDEDMKSSGEEFKKLTAVPFNLIEM